MSSATNGRKREHRVRNHLVDHGWHLVSRSAGSKGPADIVMVHPDQGLALIQVGPKGKSIGPTERARLVALADLCSALPLIATPLPGVGIRYRVVTRGPASTWHPYDPTREVAY